ncbi:MAG: resolvase [Clostridium sp.]
MKIYSKGSSLNESERLDLARLLIKAGYTVKLGRDKIQGKSTYIHYVEYREDNDER